MVSFVKMQGLGNDFMVVNALHTPFNPSSYQIKQWSNRRLGIGFDQLLILDPHPAAGADFSCRIFNADGTAAEQCGNGVRCLGRLVLDEGLVDPNASIRLATPGCVVTMSGLKNGDIRVNMGAPLFDPAEIPAKLTTDSPEYTHDFAGEPVRFSLVNMGNPHAVIHESSICDRRVVRLGQALGSDPLFPAGINVGFSQVMDPQAIVLRVFERGAGETQACGSGACAAVVAGRRMGYLQERVQVEQAGGTLWINWQGPGQAVWMEGPAQRVYQGSL